MPLPALAVSSCTSNVGRRLPPRGTASTSGACCAAPARSAGHDRARAAACLASSAWLPHTRIRGALQFIHALDGSAGRGAAACGRGRALCMCALLPGRMGRLWAHVLWRRSAYEECRETRKRNMPHSPRGPIPRLPSRPPAPPRPWRISAAAPAACQPSSLPSRLSSTAWRRPSASLTKPYGASSRTPRTLSAGSELLRRRSRAHWSPSCRRR